MSTLWYAAADESEDDSDSGRRPDAARYSLMSDRKPTSSESAQASAELTARGGAATIAGLAGAAAAPVAKSEKATTAAATCAPRARDLTAVRTSRIGRTPLLNVGGVVPTMAVRCRGTGGGGRGSVRIGDHGQPTPSHASRPVRTLDDGQR